MLHPNLNIKGLALDLRKNWMSCNFIKVCWQWGIKKMSAPYVYAGFYIYNVLICHLFSSKYFYEHGINIRSKYAFRIFGDQGLK